ncbi:MAG TPA: DUF3142 domain-containing protein [Pyrinomonadaceae bacterium]|jgi:hypothetical protein
MNTSWLRLFLLIIGITGCALMALAWSLHRPRKWEPHQVPIAFWYWRNESAKQTDIDSALKHTGARTLFLRAGQIDYKDGKLKRIRRVTGVLPRGTDVHLVYNGTPALLDKLESVKEAELASAISAAYLDDLKRATKDQSHIAGVQLDLDMPTRLLKRYRDVLHSLRQQLPPSTTISITGLPTWMNSPDLAAVLLETDFWIPQCYGAEIPDEFDELIPISSVEGVTDAVTRARALGEPFYAGLSAYSYVLLYGGDGRLLTVRGDMNPATIANDPHLKFIERKPFEPARNSGAKVTSEWRYVYQARAAGVVDDMILRAGDLIVVDAPSTESLRATARAVRESAGEHLLGICIFRLPSLEDPATLASSSIEAALKDVDGSSDIGIKATLASEDTLLVSLENAGPATPLLNESITIDLTVPPGQFRIAGLRGFSWVDLLCNSGDGTLQHCSERLANTIRLRASALPVAEVAEISLSAKAESPKQLPVDLTVHLDDGRTIRKQQLLQVTFGD